VILGEKAHHRQQHTHLVLLSCMLVLEEEEEEEEFPMITLPTHKGTVLEDQDDIRTSLPISS
jgi:hypothetical protein